MMEFLDLPKQKVLSLLVQLLAIHSSSSIRRVRLDFLQQPFVLGFIQLRKAGFYTGASLGSPQLTVASNGASGSVTTRGINTDGSQRLVLMFQRLYHQMVLLFLEQTFLQVHRLQVMLEPTQRFLLQHHLQHQFLRLF